MATPAQITANQANSQKSTGPRTAEGKAKVATNHTTHGLSIKRHIVLPHEDPEEYEELLNQYKTEHFPGCAIERYLIARLAEAEWRLRRCTRIETALIAGSGLEIEQYYAENEEKLHKLERYTAAHRRDYSRTLKDFLAARRARRIEAEAGLFTGPCFPDPEPPAPEPAATPQQNTSNPIPFHIPAAHRNELRHLQREDSRFDPARRDPRMTHSLALYLRDRNNLAVVRQFLKQPCQPASQNFDEKPVAEQTTA